MIRKMIEKWKRNREKWKRNREKLEAWDTLLNGAQSNRAPARTRELSTMAGFQAAVLKIDPTVNTKGRGRPKKDDKKND